MFPIQRWATRLLGVTYMTYVRISVSGIRIMLSRKGWRRGYQFFSSFLDRGMTYMTRRLYGLELGSSGRGGFLDFCHSQAGA